ncbi:MAG: YggS family pyridoxal phosphate-dependent enzyme [bacterium]|nr:YggS family pyridoxal phosphate-dependent enzyme [bacterium]
MAEVKDRIFRAAERSGRDPAQVKLVAVTKQVGIDKIREAISAGATIIGESRVQEASRKYDQIGSAGVTWHLVGHLQTNKVKPALEIFDFIHSVDRLSLALEIDRRARQMGKVVPALVQVKVAAEKSKFGIPGDQLSSLLSEIDALEGLQIEGLMTIVPLTTDPEETRPYFRRLRELAEEIKQQRWKSIKMRYLSMGMSNDFEVAIEEGANMVRIGSAIFS